MISLPRLRRRRRCHVAYRCRIFRPSVVGWESTRLFTCRSRRAICSSRRGRTSVATRTLRMCSTTLPSGSSSRASWVRGRRPESRSDRTVETTPWESQRPGGHLTPVGLRLPDPVPQALRAHAQVPGDLGDGLVRRQRQRDRIPLELGRVPLTRAALLTHYLWLLPRDLPSQYPAVQATGGASLVVTTDYGTEPVLLIADTSRKLSLSCSSGGVPTTEPRDHSGWSRGSRSGKIGC